MRYIKIEDRIINNIINVLNEKAEQGYSNVICGIRDFKKTGNYGYLPYDIIQDWLKYRYCIKEDYTYAKAIECDKTIKKIDNLFYEKISENCPNKKDLKIKKEELIRKREDRLEKERHLLRNEKELSEMIIETYNKYFSKYGRIPWFCNPKKDGLCVYKTELGTILYDDYVYKNIYTLELNNKLTNEQIEKVMICYIAWSKTNAYSIDNEDLQAEFKRIAEEKGISVEELNKILYHPGVSFEELINII